MSEHISTGDGYTCARCGQWVPNFTYHACTGYVWNPAGYYGGWYGNYGQDAILERIAKALERIADAMEGK